MMLGMMLTRRNVEWSLATLPTNMFWESARALAKALLALDDAARELLRVLETDGGYTEDALEEAQQALEAETLQPQAAMRALRACLLPREGE